MYLFFDTETNGLPEKWDAPADDIDNWPRIIQIAWIEQDKNREIISTGNYYIKPLDFEISEESKKIHRISKELAMERGYAALDVLNVFNSIIKKSKYVIAHNVFFDDRVLSAEFKRHYLNSNLLDKKKICTMTEAIDYCNLPSASGKKPPKLSELYYKLYDKNFADSHDAFADIQVTKDCFWELIDRGVIDIENLKLAKSYKSSNSDEDKKTDSLSLF